MKQLCDSIETLAMTLHDGELAGDELRDVELHLTECAACREHTEQQGAAMTSLRRKLAPPPTPDLLRGRVMKALDAEDRAARRPLATWLLPGAAAVAAVAALALFISTRNPAPANSIESTIAIHTTRTRPLEVEGAATNQWVQRNYDPSVALPTLPALQLLTLVPPVAISSPPSSAWCSCAPGPGRRCRPARRPPRAARGSRRRPR